MNNNASRDADMVQAVDLTKIYRTPAAEVLVFEKLNFKIERGRLLAIIGPSGAGKSTLLHLMGGLDNPTSGQLLLRGENISTWSLAELARFRNRHVGFVFQFHHLLPEFTAIENTMMPRLIRADARGEAEAAAYRLLKRVGLEHRVNHRVGELSGGEQQRVAVARALAGEPELLLADEPTGNLDFGTAERVFETIRELHSECGLTSVIVTHNERIASECERVWHIEAGRLAAGSC